MALGIGAVYVLWMFNVLKMQSSFESMCQDGMLPGIECDYMEDNVVFYDSYFYCTDSEPDCWSDEALARDYLNQLSD